eukprot:TRINITY_DN7444_c0_g1_i1.p1 TRINITY_DN7444_c0_g1~~TRINITY_DN7444_c0_g1_i1.p1  ORF type:complete len:387 (-),score=87.07 TRINITY_DN7444_c0_g1_i1:9-1169(-)
MISGRDLAVISNGMILPTIWLIFSLALFKSSRLKRPLCTLSLMAILYHTNSQDFIKMESVGPWFIYMLSLSSVWLSMRSLDLLFFSLGEEFGRVGGTREEQIQHQNVFERLKFYADLICSFRGVEWNWKPKSMIFKENDPHSRREWAIIRMRRALFCFFTFYLSNWYLMHVSSKLNSSPSNQEEYLGIPYWALDFPKQSGFFHPLLDSHWTVRIPATFVGATWVYSYINGGYYLLASIGVSSGLFGPKEFPDLFDHPFASNSLSDLWSRRWHQLFRRCFYSLGFRSGVKVQSLFGFHRSNIFPIILSFIVSGFFHQIGSWKATGEWDNGCLFFFILMGSATILEFLLPKKWRRMWLWLISMYLGPIVIESWMKMGTWNRGIFFWEK